MGNRYLIEDLVTLTGYSMSMIYDLTHLGLITPPVRGLDPNLYGSKGSYSEESLAQLRRYKELKLQGLKKVDIISIMKREVQDVSVLQG